MKKGIKLLFICLLLVLRVNYSYGQRFQQAESWLFSFPEGKNLLLADYGENARELQQMRESLRQGRVSLLEGTEHLLLVSHISSHQYLESSAINEASLRASRLRAYIKEKVRLPHECIVFYVDRSGHYANQLHVYRVPSAVPWFANQEINYSESLYPKSIDESVDRYGAIPFVDLYKRSSGDSIERVVYRISDALFDREELADYLLQTDPRVGANHAPLPRPEPEHPQPERVVSPPSGSAPSGGDPVASGVLRPFNLAVKTNLLPWFTFAPSVMLGNGPADFQRGSFMPNLELEYAFSRRWSVSASALHAYYRYGSRPENLWGVSSLMLEPRFWMLPDNRFRWMWIGAFGQYGDFDVRGDKISTEGLYGRTGQYLSAGLSVGCLVPLGAGFCVEGVLLGGYRSVFGGEKYRHDEVDDKNYRESLFSSTGMMLGFKLNVVYRFGFK